MQRQIVLALKKTFGGASSTAHKFCHHHVPLILIREHRGNIKCIDPMR